eukprot:1150819-Pelagomonas_calceolata.AAC.5
MARHDQRCVHMCRIGQAVDCTKVWRGMSNAVCTCEGLGRLLTAPKVWRGTSHVYTVCTCVGFAHAVHVSSVDPLLELKGAK